MTPDAIFAELDQLADRRRQVDAREQHLLALLRSSVGAHRAAVDRPPTEWLTTAQAAELTGLSVSQVARLCRQNVLADDPANGFAKWVRRWLIWPARFHAYLQRRPKRRSR